MMAFVLFLAFVVSLRLIELAISRSNEKWLLQKGAVEYGREHYPYMVTMHVLFLLALVVEFSFRAPVVFHLFFFCLFLLLICLKIWVILTLGKYWNTKIYRVANFPLINNGPYKWVKHPNYIIVIAEIVVIPLVFHLYCTAVLFTMLNAAMLYVRIKVENKALCI